MFRRIILSVAGVSLLASCTPAQIATLGGIRQLSPTDVAALEALPDAPIVVDGKLLTTDGSLVELPDEHLDKEARFWRAVGRTSWATRPDLHRWLVCVARRESNLDPRAHNPRGADNSYGYMQINMRGSLGPDRMAAFRLSTYEDLFIPEVNLEAAWELYIAAGTSPWKATRGGC